MVNLSATGQLRAESSNILRSGLRISFLVDMILRRLLEVRRKQFKMLRLANCNVQLIRVGGEH